MTNLPKILLITCALFFFSTDRVDASLWNSLPRSLSTLISKELKGFRLAKPKDFLKTIQDLAIAEKKPVILRSVIKTDINSDGKSDYILLLIRKTERKFVFYAFLNNGKGGYQKVLLSENSWDKSGIPGIWKKMRLKTGGDEGITRKKYFSKEYINHRAIETSAFDPTHCSEGYYFKKEELKTVRVCK